MGFKILMMLWGVIFFFTLVTAQYGYNDPTLPKLTPSTATSTTTIGGNVTDFLDLLDTPASYSGEGGNCAIVNVGENGLEFGACGSGGGNPFDQELNTTDLVKFNGINTTNNITFVNEGDGLMFPEGQRVYSTFNSLRLKTIASLYFVVGGITRLQISATDFTAFLDFGMNGTQKLYFDSESEHINSPDGNNLFLNSGGNITLNATEKTCLNTACSRYFEDNGTSFILQG